MTDYVSNLIAPDLRAQFKHYHWRSTNNDLGHLVGSDWNDIPSGDPFWDRQKQCGSWTRDEAAILYSTAQTVGGRWLELGGATGWTAAHLSAAGCPVVSVDPEFARTEFRDRFVENLGPLMTRVIMWDGTSHDFFRRRGDTFDGIVIDGDHSEPAPLKDAQNASRCISDRGVILFHDARGEPIKQGVRWLASRPGWRVKLYRTPHGVALCYRDPFVPPEHVFDPKVGDFTL